MKTFALFLALAACAMALPAENGDMTPARVGARAPSAADHGPSPGLVARAYPSFLDRALGPPHRDSLKGYDMLTQNARDLIKRTIEYRQNGETQTGAIRFIEDLDDLDVDDEDQPLMEEIEEDLESKGDDREIFEYLVGILVNTNQNNRKVFTGRTGRG